MPPKFYVKGEIFKIFQVSYPENSLAIQKLTFVNRKNSRITLVMNEENYQIFPEKGSWLNIKNYETEKSITTILTVAARHFGENG